MAHFGATDSLYWSVPSKGYIRGCKATDCAAGQPNLIQGNPGVAMTGCNLIPTKLNGEPDVLDNPVSIAADA